MNRKSKRLFFIDLVIFPGKKLFRLCSNNANLPGAVISVSVDFEKHYCGSLYMTANEKVGKNGNTIPIHTKRYIRFIILKTNSVRINMQMRKFGSGKYFFLFKIVHFQPSSRV